MITDLRALTQALPESIPDVDRYVLESILDQCTFKTDTSCIEWHGYTQENGYPIYNSSLTGVLPIRPFMYRLFYDPTHNYGRVNRLFLICDNKACVSPEHLLPVRAKRALRADFASRHKRQPRSAANGRL